MKFNLIQQYIADMIQFQITNAFSLEYFPYFNLDSKLNL
jgi:hypothetical protein